MNTYKYPIEMLAACSHEINKIYCESLGDFTQPHWEDAPAWQKSSAIQGVIGALVGNTPEQSHEQWMKEKNQNGWKYGPVKNLDTKEHPCFVPYSELSEEQKKKDELFTRVVSLINSILEK